MNLVLHGIEDFQVVREDTLRSPAFTDSATGGLATFDCVIANPPFSLKEWGRDVWEADPWGRAAFGLPPESYGDYAWVQHMVASMAAGTGRMAVVLPQGALFRKDAEGRIRQALLEQDLIEAVIGLAPNIFYGTGLAPAVVVLRRDEARRAEAQGADRRRFEPVPQGPRAELPRPGARRPDRRRGCAPSRTSPDRAKVVEPRRDQGRGLDAEHLALRAAARRRGHPAAARGRRRVQAGGRRGAGGRGSAARSADRGRLAVMSKAAEHLSQQELESYLWGAANLLRGLIDAGDYKQYIFPLLFFKRLSDVWDEEYAAALERDRRRRATPARRRTIASRFPKARTGPTCAPPRATSGARCVNAFRAIEAANPKRLAGIFGNASWTDKAQMPDETLKNLIEHFSQHDARPDGGARGRARQRLRVPDQAVRRRQRPHRAGVLHQPHARAPDDADARAAARRAHLRPDLSARAAC